MTFDRYTRVPRELARFQMSPEERTLLDIIMLRAFGEDVGNTVTLTLKTTMPQLCDMYNEAVPKRYRKNDGKAVYRLLKNLDKMCEFMRVDSSRGNARSQYQDGGTTIIINFDYKKSAIVETSQYSQNQQSNAIVTPEKVPQLPVREYILHDGYSHFPYAHCGREDGSTSPIPDNQDTPAPTQSKKSSLLTMGKYRHVQIAEADYKAIVDKWGNEIVSEYVRRVDEYCETTGKRYKNYAAVLEKWIIEDNPKIKQKPSYDLDVVMQTSARLIDGMAQQNPTVPKAKPTQEPDSEFYAFALGHFDGLNLRTIPPETIQAAEEKYQQYIGKGENVAKFALEPLLNPYLP